MSVTGSRASPTSVAIITALVGMVRSIVEEMDTARVVRATSVIVGAEETTPTEDIRV